MAINRVDILTIIFAAIATGIGVSFPFLPASLPYPLSLPILAGLAMFFTALSVLLQVSDIDEVDEEDQSTTSEGVIKIPQETYERQMALLSRRDLSDNPQRTLPRRGRRRRTGNTDSHLRAEIEELKEKITEIEDSGIEEDDTSIRSHLNDINSEIESMNEELENIKQESVSNFEFEQEIRELDEKISEEKNNVRILYQVIKNNVEGFEPPEQKNSKRKESIEENDDESTETTSEEEKEIEREK